MKIVRACDRLGNHLPTQVKDNQPSLRRRLQLGVAGRKPSGSAKTETTGHNRWETREFDGVSRQGLVSRYALEKLIKTVLRLERTVCKRAPATGLCAQTTEVVFCISSASNQIAAALERVDPRPLADRERQRLRARYRLRRGRFPHPQEPRYCRSSTILRSQSDPRRWRLEHPKRSLARRPKMNGVDLTPISPTHSRGSSAVISPARSTSFSRGPTPGPSRSKTRPENDAYV